MIGNISVGAIEKHREKLIKLSKDIWDNPEGAYEEYKACEWSAKMLEEEGFNVEIGVGGVPTAIKATWGEGHPVIGFLGEYDALPGLSQKVKAEKDPVTPGAYGHGCGHNLLGVACIGAVLGMKEEMIEKELKGTIVYYGCPAEEVLTGKGFMAKGGAFDNLDINVTYHPGFNNYTSVSGTALISSKFHFKGKTAHAAHNPQNGRSALDAVELTNVGANYLREHVSTEVRIHYAITDGGDVPNVVPAKACVWYFVRAPKHDEVREVYRRLLDVAKGAALMTGTTFIEEHLGGCYNALYNETLAEVMYESLNEIPEEEYTPEEILFAQRINEKEMLLTTKNIKAYNMPPGSVFFTGALPPKYVKKYGSTDAGDVQHIAPGVGLRTVCYPLGTPSHSWQRTACSGHSIGQKGMIRASKIMALFGLKIINNPEVYKKAKIEFDASMGNTKYVSLIPNNIKAPSTRKKAGI